MITVTYRWDDGHTRVFEYPTKVRGLRHNGLRPTSMDVSSYIGDIKVVEWLNECEYALAYLKK